jgi:hypothetical protein
MPRSGSSEDIACRKKNQRTLSSSLRAFLLCRKAGAAIRVLRRYCSKIGGRP